MEIKDIIKKRREELGLTYEQLGNMVGVGKSTVRKWETGLISNMRRDNIVALAKALNVSPALIMGWGDKTEDYTEELVNLKIENDLKEIILNKYNNIEEFCTENDILYKKVDKIFKKGIADTDIQLIFKICSILDIDVDSLIKGEVRFNNPLLKYAKTPTKLTDDQSILLVNFDNLDTEDRNKVLDYTNLLSSQDKYKKENAIEVNSPSNDEICATKVVELPKKEKSIWEEPGKEHLMPVAAHAKENSTEEDIQHDLDMMDDENW